jgi:hypothetical protein
MSTTIRLSSMHKVSNYAPLGVLGYCLQRSNFFSPLFSDLQLPLKTVEHAPAAKLVDLLVSILVGCRAISQVNTRLRPDVALAQAWGRQQFAEQSTLTRTLDVFDEGTVNQLRQGSERLLHQVGRTFRHDFAQELLWLDIDLTPLPISKLAEASSKGKFAKKTVMAASWRVSMRRSIMRLYFRTFIQASKIVARLIRRFWSVWRAAWASPAHKSNGRCCVVMLALAAMPM